MSVRRSSQDPSIRLHKGLLTGQRAIDDITAIPDRIEFVIIDTLNRNFGPGNENATEDLTRFAAAADGDDVKALSLDLILVPLGTDEDGDDYGSLVPIKAAEEGEAIAQRLMSGPRGSVQRTLTDAATSLTKTIYRNLEARLHPDRRQRICSGSGHVRGVQHTRGSRGCRSLRRFTGLVTRSSHLRSTGSCLALRDS